MPTTARAVTPATWTANRLSLRWTVCCLALALVAPLRAEEVRTTFRVKYVAEGAVYIDGGRAQGLAKGMRLQVRSPATAGKAPEVIAELEVASITQSSAVCDLVRSTQELRRGDIAVLAQDAVELLVRDRSLGSKRIYPAVVSFDPEADPIEEEVRAAVPRPPSPEVNRARGRIGMDYTTVAGLNGTASSAQTGMVLRLDVTRIAGTFWNLNGYWRGRWNSRTAPEQETLFDLQNRTYQLALTYNNPGSRMILGFGRMHLPWAASLDSLDGGYFGWRLHPSVITGVFAGSTPDPTSWSYDPQRQIAGAFLNVERGSFDAVRYSGTYGMAYEARNWKIERPLVFLENAVFYKHAFSVYHTLQADQPRAVLLGRREPAGISRSYLTVRLQPHRRLALDLNHNYFRDIPTFDSRLIGTGQVDKLLFEGLSGGLRLELPRHVAVYGSVGRSNRTGDARNSWNRMYGISWARIPWLNLDAGARYSSFQSSFGSGTYRSFSLSRDFIERYRVEAQAGKQVYASVGANDLSARFVSTTIDAALGARFFLMGGFTVYRGTTQQYNQFSTTVGYRFDNKAGHHVD